MGQKMEPSMDNLEFGDPAVGLDSLQFGGNDAFKDVGDGDDAGDKVHIRVQQRSGRKSITTIQGLSADLDLKKILKAFKKTLSCNGSIIEHDQYGRVIQVQGDQRKSIKEFLIEEEVVKKDCVVVHGF